MICNSSQYIKLIWLWLCITVSCHGGGIRKIGEVVNYICEWWKWFNLFNLRNKCFYFNKKSFFSMKHSSIIPPPPVFFFINSSFLTTPNIQDTGHKLKPNSTASSTSMTREFSVISNIKIVIAILVSVDITSSSLLKQTVFFKMLICIAINTTLGLIKTQVTNTT